MQSNWQRVWRDGIAPLISRDGLLALEAALEGDDERLLQGTTCAPSYFGLSIQRRVCGACVLAWIGWHTEKLITTTQVEEYFHHLCDAVDQALAEPAACRYFLNWYDRTPRDEMRRLLLIEVRRALARTLPLAA